MTTAISIEQISKNYRLGQIGTGTLSQDLAAWWARFRGTPNELLAVGDGKPAEQDGEEIWALRDVSFQVQQGEALGIIGRNGAGKSTLLKLLSRVTAPTSGEIKIKGRVASLLEVGTGFHPELTGRENVYLNGAILGMSRQEIDDKFDEILDFSEIGKFIDTPVKRYSSGMYVRLAFAVAAHLDPEILVLDEVLAVGDAEFQKKCLGKMGDVAGSGRTVLFVSHNMAAVQKLCTRAVWIDRGVVQQLGLTDDVITAYLAKVHGFDLQGEIDLSEWPDRYGRGGARIVSARLLDESGSISSSFKRLGSLDVEFDFESQSSHELIFSANLIAESGERILHLSQFDTPGLVPALFSGKYRVRFHIPDLPLNEGNFKFFLGIHTDTDMPIDVVRNVLQFEVIDARDSIRPFKTGTNLAYCWTPNHSSVQKIG